MYPTICYFLLLSIVEAADKGSLTFVIDHTASMSEEIERVKIAAQDIANNIFNKAESEVQNIVLVTFDDPTAYSSDGNYVHFITKTTNFYDFQRNLGLISLVGNYDCPEMCLSGTLRGLQESDHGSLVYVFADDSPKDAYWAGRNLVTEIMSVGQKNEHQIVFIITPRPSHCRNDGRDFIREIQPYYEIAAASNGQVFYLDGKTEVGQILEYVKETVSGQRTVIISRIIPANVWENVPFTLDAKTEYGIISTSGESVELLLHESPVNAFLTHVTWLNNVKVAKVNVAGDYVVRVKGGGVTSIIVFGRTDFVFQFGFSRSKPSSLSETTKQPITGKQYYLLIKIEDKEGDVDITTVEIDTKDYVLLLRLPVKMIYDKMYLTELFYVPAVPFKITVLGMTGRGIIRRANRTPIDPVLSPDPDEYPKIDKTVTPSLLRVQEGSNSKLSCRIIGGKPDPTITWYVNGAAASNNVDLVLSPATRADAGSYKCVATNKLGSDTHIIDLVITYPPSITSEVTTLEKVEVGTILTLPCKVDSLPISTIKWFFNGVDITKDSLYHIDDSNMLSFTAALSNSGDYTCEATNEVNTAKKTQKVFVYDKPRIDKSEKDIIAKEGQSLSLKCRVTSTPAATIKWFINGVATTTTDSTIDIASVNRKNTGSYKCVATNDYGDDTHDIKLTVWYPPSITSEVTTLEKVEVGKTITLPCQVDSFPVSTNKWFFNGVDITKDLFYQIDANNRLRFTAALSNSGDYTCEATNVVSTAKKTQGVFVYEKPKIDKSEKDIIVKEGQSLSVKCRVTSTPAATIKWFINGVATTTTDSTIDIASVNRKNTGSYKCVATNDYGDDTHDIKLTVWYPPSITSKVTTTEKVEVGKTIILPCQVDSFPVSTNKWFFNGVDITKESFYQIDADNSLSFTATLSNSGDYTCEATNVVSTAKKTQGVFVYEKPKIDKSEKDIIAKEGQSLSVKCRVTSTPAATIKWFINGVATTTTDSTIVIASVNRKNTGSYKCVATNDYGDDTHDINLTVWYPPSITSKVTMIEKVEVGKTITLPCQVDSFPVSTYKWFFNGVDITKDTLYQIDANNRLSFTAALSNSGDYTCEATNVVNTAKKTQKVFVYEKPKIDKSEKAIIAKEGQTLSVKCRVTSTPAATITWFINGVATTTTDSTIDITPVNRKNTGSYKCVATNDYGDDTHDINLTVWYPPSITSKVTTIEKVEVGTTITLPCQVDSFPVSTNKWFFNGVDITKDSFYQIDANNKLSFTAALSNSGDYTCDATNVVSTAKKTQKIFVYEKPKIDKSEKDIIAKEGQSLSVKCRVTSTPAATIKWFINGVATTTIDSTIDITPVNRKNTGSYKCVATNDYGDDTHDIKLTVWYPPSITSKVTTIEKVEVGTTITLPCQVDSFPVSTNKWFFNGVDITKDSFYQIDENNKLSFTAALSNSGDYTCDATNVVSTTKKTQKIFVYEKPKIDKSEKDIIAKEGQSLSVKCRVTSTPAATIKWFINGVATTTTDSTIDITPVNRKNTGSYKCVATNDYGDDTHDIKLTVWYPPSITSKVTTIEKVEVGTTITLPCQVDSFPVSTNKWFFNGVDITKDSFYQIDANNKLSFTAALSNSGDYTCDATNVVSTAKKTQKIFVYEKPKIDKSEKDIIAKQGQSLSVKCRVTSTPAATIKWFINGVATTTTDSTIDITPVNRKNTGSYKCVATNDYGDDTHDIKLTVWYPPSITSKVTTIEKVEVGTTITLPCQVDSFPVSTNKWFFNGIDITKDSFYQIDANNKLSFTAALSNSGDYTCDATNVVSTAKKTQKIFVYEKPKIDKSEKDIIAKEGQSLSVKCRVTSTPAATIKWFINGVATTTTDSTIDITPVNRKNTGSYKCVATNDYGDDTHDIKLTVWYPPSITSKVTTIEKMEVGKTITLPCQVDSFPVSTNKWFFNGVDITKDSFYQIDSNNMLSFTAALSNSGDYTCEATNVVSTAKKTQKVFVYEKPRIDKSEKDIIAKEGQSLSVKCRVTSTPEATIKWFINGIETTITDAIINITPAERKDTGSYKCVATNGFGDDTYDAYLTVWYRPSITTKAVSPLKTERGNPVTLFCKVDSLPIATIRWFFNGVEITSSSSTYRIDHHHKLSFSTTNTKFFSHETYYSLFSNSFTASLVSTGDYTCEATNVVDTATLLQKVYVYEKPKIDKSVTEVIVLQGDRALVECPITAATPKPTIKWKVKYDHGTPKTFNKDLFHFDNIRSSEAGHYICEADNGYGQDSHSVHVIVNYIPEVKLIVVPDKTVAQGTQVWMRCIATGYPKPDISWYLNSKEIVNDKQYFIKTNIYKPDVTSDLRFNAQDYFKQTGKYTCMGSNGIGHTSATEDLTVHVPVDVQAPKHSNPDVMKGENYYLHCNSIGYPRPDQKWTYCTKKLENCKDVHNVERRFKNGTILLKNMALEDSGFYFCNASNLYSFKQIVYDINVNSKPIIKKTSDNINVEAVKDDLFVVLSCNASGFPEPIITWQMYGKSLPSAPDETIHKDGTLYLRDAKSRHSGFYLCEARNIHGFDQVSYDLDVRNYPKAARPMITVDLKRGESRDIACNVPHAGDITVPQDKVRWYKGSTKLSSDKYLRIENANLIGATKYTCRVSYWDKMYSESATVRVIVI